MVPCASCMHIGQGWGFDKRNASRPTARNLAKQRVLSPREKFETIALTLGFRHGNNVAVPLLSSIQVVAFLIWWGALFVLFMIHKRATEQDDEMVCVRHDLIT